MRAAAQASSAERRAFTLEDVYRVRAVAGPVLSPDGRSVAYTVTVNDFEKAQRTVEIWRADTDPAHGGTPRRLAFAEGKRCEAPAFSPDGRTLAFVSDRAGEPQLYLMPVDGGEPEAKTKVPGGISGPLVFTPDGRSIVFTADVHADCGADKACNEQRQEAREKGKLKAHLADALLYRHWTSWKDGQRSHLLAVSLGDGTLRDLTPGDFDSPTFSIGGDHGYDVSPDGRELAFASNRAPDPARSTNSDVWTVALRGSAEELRAPRNVTAANPAWDGTPRYSPDGRWLAWRTQATPGYESDRFRLAVQDRRTGAIRHGFGQQFTRAISTDWTGKVMEDVSKVTDALAALPYVDRERMGAMGWSWGGYAMMWLEGHDTRFKALAAAGALAARRSATTGRARPVPSGRSRAPGPPR